MKERGEKEGRVEKEGGNKRGMDSIENIRVSNFPPNTAIEGEYPKKPSKNDCDSLVLFHLQLKFIPI